MATTIRLGVTGLRQSGKTVFLTALAYHLLERGFGGNESCDVFKQNGIRIFPGKKVPCAKEFPFQAHFRKLQQETPEWPAATVSESELIIEFGCQGSKTGLIERTKHLFTGARNGHRRIRLHLHDYPGEFLLDLPMIRLTFQEWCRASLERIADQLPESHDEYIREVDGLSSGCSYPDAKESFDPELLHLAQTSYGRLIASLRSQGFEMIQPGMILAGWDGKEVQEVQRSLPFVPLPETSRSTSLYRAMETAYSTYCRDRIRPFLKRLSRCNRQIILVDLFRILRSGRIACYNDARACLREIIGEYVYSDSGLARMGRRLLPTRFGVARSINRVVLAATKADHATMNDRQNLRLLLQEITDVLQTEWQGAVPQPECRYLSSRLCVKDEEDEDQFGKYAVLVGQPLAPATDGITVKVNPGEVPEKWPDEDWDAEQSFPDFRPCRIPAKAGAVWPNIGLADVVWHVLKDCLPTQ